MFAGVVSAYGWEGYPTEVEEFDLLSDEVFDELAGAYRLEGRVSFRVERWGSGFEVTFDCYLL